jgi:hypothetical protein
MWPTISNINDGVASTILSYANDSLKASGLNAWIRVYSGAKTSRGNGLILESNTNFELFSAAGEASIYGNANRSGAIGKDWNGRTVVSGVGRVLRPSPIITTFNSKEGQDQISRTCDFSITCFSLEQLELIQAYFMEPGYSVAVEWGQNTRNSLIGMVDTNSGQGGILKSIADTTLNNGELSKKRFNTRGEYDIFLGFIVGSTVTNEGENFKVDVKLRGAPSLPTYLQSHNRITVKQSGLVEDPDKSKTLYKDTELLADINGDTSSRGIAAKRRFKYMFNELPAFRQTENVKKLIDGVQIWDFINFDKVINATIDEFFKQKDYVFIGQNETVELSVGDKTIDIEKEKLFSENKYIRFGLAMKILQEMGNVDKYEIGGKPVSFKIDIENCIIGAFPRMFSTKASKLIIPGFVPNFGDTYFLSSAEISQLPDGKINNLNPINITNGFSFVERGADLNKFGLSEKKGYYGYLKTLFVNFDMFKEKIEQKNKNIREILLDILNEMSSAVNSFWNFQIVEGESSDGSIVITVVDENWIGQNPDPDNVKIFQHTGIGSPFLNSSLDISIPAEMAGKIINERLGADGNPDMSKIKVGTLFSAETDLFLPRVQAGGATTPVSGAAAPVSDTQRQLDEARARRDALITREVVGADGVTLYYGIAPGERFEKIIKTKAPDGTVNYWTNPRIPEEYEIDRLEAAVEEEAAEAALQRVSSNLERIDVVPMVSKLTIAELSTNNADDIKARINKSFFVHCLDDTDYFDKMRNYLFETRGSTNLSQPLPIKYSFTIFGNSGIRRGDTFNIAGIPRKYRDQGIFQVTGIEHTISGMRWETTIEAMYRQFETSGQSVAPVTGQAGRTGLSVTEEASGGAGGAGGAGGTRDATGGRGVPFYSPPPSPPSWDAARRSGGIFGAGPAPGGV